MSERIKLGVCAGRHEMPVEDYIFNKPIEDVTDVSGLHKQAVENLQRIMKERGIDIKCCHLESRGGDYSGYVYPVTIDLYCTGLTVAVLTAIDVCTVGCYLVNIYHFDMKSGKYYCQNLYL